jgi:hypothetical protein
MALRRMSHFEVVLLDGFYWMREVEGWWCGHVCFVMMVREVRC